MSGDITVETVLKRTHFEYAKVVAGESGTRNRIKWVHVVEVIDIQHLLKGEELILTTGLGWNTNDAQLLVFMQQLIECKAAGLCIEVGTNVEELPVEAIQLANQHQFPIILFQKKVPFVEITQDLHALIINQQVQLLTTVENYSQKLNEILLKMSSRIEIVTLLQQYTNVQVIIKESETYTFIPNCIDIEKEKIVTKIESPHYYGSQVIRKHVHILGGDQLEIILFDKKAELQEMDQLLLDRTVTALAQHLLRELYVEERRGVEEAQWLEGWLKGRHSIEQVEEYMYLQDPHLTDAGAVVCVLAKECINSDKSELTYQKLLIRTAFANEGFSAFLTEMPMYIGWILVNKRSSHDWKERLYRAVSKLKQVGRKDWYMRLSAVGVGQFVSSWQEVPKSYKTANEALSFIPLVKKKKDMYIFDELQLYRMLTAFTKDQDMEEMILANLKPILDYDAKFNSNLLETLKAYLACKGSKQETAKQLFIVRQTLYHRIDKIESLLGFDFMEPERRLLMEWMIFAYESLRENEKGLAISKSV